MILFQNCRLFDGLGSELLEDRHVLIEGERIKEVADRPIRAADAQIIDLKGRTLMPGLIDAHFHAMAADPDFAKMESMPRSLLHQHARLLLEAALQRGFTTVRDAGGADYGLAMAVETVSRSLTRFQDAGIVRVDRNLVSILDQGALRAAAAGGAQATRRSKAG